MNKRYFLIPAVSLAMLAGLAVLFTCMGADDPGRPNRGGPTLRRLSGSQLSASGQIVTTINKSLYPSPTPFSFGAISKSYTSSAETVFDQGSVAASSASGVVLSSGTGSMQMLYAYSPALDGTLSIFANTAGTGSAISGGTVAITAGQPFEWDSSSGTTTLMLTGTNSITFTAGTTAGGLATATTATGFNAAALYP